MRVLLSTIGSRGDVQPLVALAFELRALGQEVHLCVPPDFRDWIESLGFSVTPIGPEVRRAALSAARPANRPSAEQLRQMAESTVATQFDTIATAAKGCDVIVGATAIQVGAPSFAEMMGVPYVFVTYCPTVVPSPQHAPTPLRSRGDAPRPATTDNRALWEADARRWTDTWSAVLNSHRAAAGLSPVSDVRGHVLTDRPWLAADPALAPWPDPTDETVFQSGAWILPDERPLSPEIEKFLSAGDPPIYFGFGSLGVSDDRVMIDSARALGRRAIVYPGWADLARAESRGDCLVIGEVNQQALFPRVAAVVHHGGAGTTTAAARAGASQVVVPHVYDQFYWADRVERLGLGTTHLDPELTLESLTGCLERALAMEVAERSRSFGPRVGGDGARAAAQRLTTGAGISDPRPV